MAKKMSRRSTPLKLFHKRDVRRILFMWEMNSQSIFQELQDATAKLFPALNKEHELRYFWVDEDDDVITMSSEPEIVDLLNLMARSRSKCLKLAVFSRSEKTTQRTLTNLKSRLCMELKCKTEVEEESPPTDVGLMSSTPLDAHFIQHTTFPEGASVQPGAVISKAWRVRNTGSEPWPVGVFLAQTELDNDLGHFGTSSMRLLTVPSSLSESSIMISQDLPLQTPVLPNQEVVLSIQMVIECDEGIFSVTHRLSTPEGIIFGDDLRTDIGIAQDESDWLMIASGVDLSAGFGLSDGDESPRSQAQSPISHLHGAESEGLHDESDVHDLEVIGVTMAAASMEGDGLSALALEAQPALPSEMAATEPRVDVMAAPFGGTAISDSSEYLSMSDIGEFDSEMNDSGDAALAVDFSTRFLHSIGSSDSSDCGEFEFVKNGQHNEKRESVVEESADMVALTQDNVGAGGASEEEGPEEEGSQLSESVIDDAQAMAVPAVESVEVNPFRLGDEVYYLSVEGLGEGECGGAVREERARIVGVHLDDPEMTYFTIVLVDDFGREKQTLGSRLKHVELSSDPAVLPSAAGSQSLQEERGSLDGAIVWANELAMLVDMGFTDVDHMVPLLIKHVCTPGSTQDLSPVVDALLGQN